MLRLTALLVVVLALPVAHAQSAAEDAAPVVADSALTAYAGPWTLAVTETPLGAIGGTLDVRPDGTGTLALPALGVRAADVSGLTVTGGALAGSTRFFSPVAGQELECTIRLAPGADGALAGEIDVEGDRAYPLTARRAAE